jgi:hypothetical protein
MNEETALPAALWIEARLRQLAGEGVFYYILQKGAYDSHGILVKVSDGQGKCRLLIRQRDLDGKLGWVNALNADLVEEKQADDYIRRSIARDPDLWAIEIEDREMNNPFI